MSNQTTTTTSNYLVYGLKIGFPPGNPMRYKIMKFNDYNITVKEACSIITSKQNIQKPETHILQITYSDDPPPNAGSGSTSNSTGNTPLSGSVGMGPPIPSASISSSTGSGNDGELKKSTSSGVVSGSIGGSGGLQASTTGKRHLIWMDENNKLSSYPLGSHDVVIELKKKYQLIKVYDGKQTMNLIVDVTKPLSDLMDLAYCKFKLRSSGDYKLYTYGREINLNNDIKTLNIDTSLPFILRDNNDPNALSLQSIQWENGMGYFVGGNGGIGGIGSDDDIGTDDINNNLSVPAKSIINPVKEGYLKKLDKKKSWKSRYFKLTDKYLYWYKSPTCVKASGMIICKDYCVKTVPSSHREYKLEFTQKHTIAGATTIIHIIKFENEIEYRQWLIPPIVLDPSSGSVNAPSISTTSSTTTGNNSRFSSKKVFGIPIEKTVSGSEMIPQIILQTIDYIEKKAMDIVGIFRLSGSVLTIEQWKAKYDKGEKVDLTQEVDPHAVAGLLKLYLRELPDPLLTYEKYDNFIAAQSIDDFPSRIKLIKHLVKSLPPVNLAVLTYLMAFVGKVATHSANNKMQVHNLSTVFGPNLIKDRQNSNDQGGNFQVLVEDTPIINALALSLIRDYQYIFNNKEVPEQKILARSLYEFAGGEEKGSDDDKDLIFPKGVTIKVTHQGTDGWWTGEYQGAKGKFPASYVELLPHSPSTLLRTKSNSNLSKKKKFLLEMESTKTKNQEMEKSNKQMEIRKQQLDTIISDLEAEKNQLLQDTTIQSLMNLLSTCTKTNKDITIIPKNIDTLFQKFEEYKASHEALSTMKSTIIEEYEQFNNNPKKRLETKEKEQLQQKYDNLSIIIDKSQKIRSKSINSKKLINDDLVEIKKIFTLCNQ